MNYYKHFAIRAALQTAVIIASWPLFGLAWWRYALVVGGMHALHIFYGKELRAS